MSEGSSKPYFGISPSMPGHHATPKSCHLDASKLFTRIAGTLLVGSALAAGAQQNQPPFNRDEFSVAQKDSALTVSFRHSACTADGHLLSVGMSGDIPALDAVTPEQIDQLGKDYRADVSPVLGQELDPLVRQLKVGDLPHDIDSLLNGRVSDSARRVFTSETADKSIVRILEALHTFDEDTHKIQWGMDKPILDYYAISETPVAACLAQTPSP